MMRKDAEESNPCAVSGERKDEATSTATAAAAAAGETAHSGNLARSGKGKEKGNFM